MKKENQINKRKARNLHYLGLAYRQAKRDGTLVAKVMKPLKPEESISALIFEKETALFSLNYPTIIEYENIKFVSALMLFIYLLSEELQHEEVKYKVISFSKNNEILIKFLENEINEKDILENEHNFKEWSKFNETLDLYKDELISLRNIKTIKEILNKCNLLKFNQNEYLKVKLLKTEDVNIYYDSEDSLLGTGFIDEDLYKYKETLKNDKTNLLGISVTETRTKLM